MQPAPEEHAEISRKRLTARLLAAALNNCISWSELPLKRKVGVVLGMLGVIALPFSFVQGWIWALCGGLAIVVGSILTYYGVELKDKSPWPPYSGW